MTLHLVHSYIRGLFTTELFVEFRNIIIPLSLVKVTSNGISQVVLLGKLPDWELPSVLTRPAQNILMSVPVQLILCLTGRLFKQKAKRETHLDANSHRRIGKWNKTNTCPWHLTYERGQFSAPALLCSLQSRNQKGTCTWCSEHDVEWWFQVNKKQV